MPLLRTARLVAVLLACAAPALLAQGTGRITGRIVDAAQGQPLVNAQIELTGTSIRTTSNIDGRYTLSGVQTGTASITVRAIGYQPKSVTGITVPANEAAIQNVSLTASVVELQEVVSVTSSAELGSVNRALEEQRNALQFVNAVSQEQIAKSPDSDAAAAVQRVSGVTVQDGKFVFVRGLGERYTVTTLNGSRLPSPEPEKKVVPFDLFPASMIEGITTAKTFTPDQAGDFSGAAVNIKTREFPDRSQFVFSTSVGANTLASGQTIARAPTAGGEWIASSTADRVLPTAVAQDAPGLGTLNPSEVTGLVRSFRNVWSPIFERGGFNGSLSASLGGARLLGSSIGYLASFSYSTGQEIRAGEQRNLYRLGATPGTLGEGTALYGGQTGRTSVLYGGLLNFSAPIGTTNRIDFNNTYTRGADNEATSLGGFFEGLGENIQLSRLTYVQREMRSNQLKGEHLWFRKHTVQWSVTNGFTNRQEPDRSDIVYLTTNEGQPLAAPRWVGQGDRVATRTFSGIREMNWDANLSDRITFDGVGGPGAFKFGGAFRSTQRFADSRAFDLNVVSGSSLPGGTLTQPGETIFANPQTVGAFANPFTLFANQFGGRYDAEEQVGGGFMQLEMALGSKLSLVTGGRYERATIRVLSNDILGNRIPAFLENNDFLPALGLTYALSPDMNLRLAGSQTLARPELRELSPVPYFDILGGLIVRGNQNLRRTLVRNADLRWEWFPNAGEVLSIGVFYKNFVSPIERAFAVQAGTSLNTFFNAPSADNYGVEAEIRKRVTPALTAFANATVMQSRINLTGAVNLPPDVAANFTNLERPMFGQSPYVLNGGLTYARGGLSATLLYNVSGRRIFEVGLAGAPDSYEEPRHLVDVSLQFPLFRTLNVRLDGRNLLDAPYRLTQGGLIRSRYQLGRILTLGFQWRPGATPVSIY